MNDATPSPLEAARRLAPLIRESADEIERIRELPRPLFEAIADAGLFHIAVPREIGGSELDFPLYVRVIEEIGKADASTGWAVNQGATFGTFAAKMQPDVARTIWTEKPRSVVANTPGATGKAVAVPGGFRVSARQGFSTGCRHASWVASQSQVFENGELRQRNGAPESRYLLIPIEQAELLDTWHTRGMRGTGTHHFEVKDVFVPTERTVFPRGAPVITGGPRYAIPLTLAFAAGDAAVALGTARSCMEAFFELAGSKTPRYVQGLLREQAISQFAVGQAEADLRSAHAFLHETVEEIWEEAKANNAVSLEVRARVRLATTHGIRQAAKIIESIYSLAGATAAFEGNLIQRHFQDVHVMTQHVQGRLATYELVGKYWMGLPIDETRL